MDRCPLGRLGIGHPGRNESPAAIRLLDRIELVAFLELEPCKKLLRKDDTNRIADLADLKGGILHPVFGRSFFHSAGGFGHRADSVIQNV